MVKIIFYSFVLLFVLNAFSVTDKPNVIFILADDMGIGDVKVYRPESKIPTPQLDQMAAEGMLFTDAHSPSTVCSPTRYAFLTGRYAFRSDRLVQGVLGPWHNSVFGLVDKDRLTVAKLFKASSYHTALIGKWHLGFTWPFIGSKPKSGNVLPEHIDWSKPLDGGPVDIGFDYYFGDDVPNYPPYIFIENDKVVGVPSVPKPSGVYGKDGPALPGWDTKAVMPAITAKSVAWIEESAKTDKPFFLFFALTAPHRPVVPADSFIGLSEAGSYGDFVVEVDWSVGQILNTLKRLGIDSNTFVFFSCDNGPESDMYFRITEYNHHSAGGYRGAKRDAWEGGHRVPTLAWWPGKIKANVSSREVITLTDLFATYADILNYRLPIDAGEDSYNLLPLLLGQTHESPVREATVHHTIRRGFAIRKGNWKYIDGQGSLGNIYKAGNPNAFLETDPPGQLYNMDTDSLETENLYEIFPDIVGELKTLLDQYKSEKRSAPLQDTAVLQTNANVSRLAYFNVSLSNGHLEVQLQNAMPIRINVFDIQGKLVSTRITSGQKTTISTASFNEGIYILNIPSIPQGGTFTFPVFGSPL